MNSTTHDRLRQLEKENARLADSCTSATRDALRMAEARNAQLRAAAGICIQTEYGTLKFEGQYYKLYSLKPLP